MKLFQSSLPKSVLFGLGEIRPECKINVLRTFADVQNVNLDYAYHRLPNLNQIILDSGTFTLNEAKNPPRYLNVKDYEIFLKMYGNLFDWCFNFDEVHGDEGTAKNFLNLWYYEDLNINVIPVIQNLDEAEYFCQNAQKYPLVAIGSTPNKDFKKLETAVNELYQAKIKVHIFAMASLEKLKTIPAYSSDSKSYSDWSIRNQVCYYDESSNKEIRFFIGGRPKKNTNFKFYTSHAFYGPYKKWLEDNLGFSVHDLHLGENLMIANCYYFYCLEKRITECHQNKGFNFDW